MKLKKLTIAMGFASALLAGCNSSSTPADFTVTAIDGYIAFGKVKAICEEGTYTGTTNAKGVAELFTGGVSIDGCTVEITGDENTYDTDEPDEDWLHTMKSLPGLNVINPFTDIASTLSKVEGNELLSVVDLKNKVLVLLGYDDNSQYSESLFGDFGANADAASEDAKVALLAQAVFDVKNQLLVEVEERSKSKSVIYKTYTAQQILAFYEAVMPKVTGVVEQQIAEIEVGGGSAASYTIKINIPNSIMTATMDALEDVFYATANAGDVEAAVAALNVIVADLKPQAQIKVISIKPVATGATGTSN